jgi:hypothetical protein
VAKTQLKKPVIQYHSILSDEIKVRYKHLAFKFDSTLQNKLNFSAFHDYKTHPTLNYKNLNQSINKDDH